MTTTTTRRARTTRSSTPPDVPVTTVEPTGPDPAASPDTLAVPGATISAGRRVTPADIPHPPVVDSGVVAGIGTGWFSGQMVTHLFSYDSPDGVWIYVDGVGWKRLSPASAFGVSHMVVIATMATTHNVPVTFYENDAGLIEQILA
jgi:hypothetical protein